MREIFYEYSASAIPPDPTVNSPKYVAQLPYATGYYKAIAREGNDWSTVTSKSFGMGVVTDYWKYYKFDGNAIDEQGVESALLNGASSYIAGKEGQALQTNSNSNDYARATMPVSDYSVSFWQLIGGAGIGNVISIADTVTSSVPQFMFGVTANNGTLATYRAYMNGGYTAKFSDYATQAWNHIAITKTTGQFKLYVNGVIKYNYTAFSYGQTYLFLGNAFSTYNNLKSFDNVRIYQRAITQSEVTEIFNAGQ